MKIPLPRNHTVYQFYLLLGVLAGAAISALAFYDYAWLQFFSPNEKLWYHRILALVAGVVSVVMLVEIFTLRFYKKHRPRDEEDA